MLAIYFIRLFCFLTIVFMVSCAPILTWVPDSSPIASCKPDRLLEWRDFSPKTPQDQRGAETAIRFLLYPTHHRLAMAFDHEHSWVRPEFIDPENMSLWRISQDLLAHEQLHFLISCLAVRQANLSMSQEDNLWKMLELTKSVAQRLNLQYDSDTNHGLDLDAQESWELEVMSQFQELGNSPASSKLNEAKEF